MACRPKLAKHARERRVVGRAGSNLRPLPLKASDESCPEVIAAESLGLCQ